MRTILVNIIIFAAVIAVCYFNIFEVFTMKYAFWIALILVIAVLGLALKVLGNPFAGGDNDENN